MRWYLGTANKQRTAHLISIPDVCRSVATSLAIGLLSLVLLTACGGESSPESQVDDDDSSPETSESNQLSPANRAGDGSAASSRVEPGLKAGPISAEQTRQRSAESAEQVLKQLDSLGWDEHTDTDPQAADLLERLRLHGDRAALAIRDYLLDDSGKKRVSPELRHALLNTLLSLDSPEVEPVALELLAGEPAPEEVLQLGGYLEWHDAGKHAETIRLAAEQALIDADPGVLLPWEFFALLGTVGNEGTAVLLTEVRPQHEAYATIALAALPDGSGLVPLEMEARQFEEGRDTLQGRLAIQLLAQAAPGSPEAAETLIDLAEKAVIPEDVWSYVLDLVEGNWEWAFEPSAGEKIGSHTFYNPAGNQVLYRISRPADALDPELEAQRLDLLDRLWPLAPPALRTDRDG
jgi:hypothetical protein